MKDIFQAQVENYFLRTVQLANILVTLSESLYVMTLSFFCSVQ